MQESSPGWAKKRRLLFLSSAAGAFQTIVSRQYIWESGAGGSFTVQKAGVHVAIMWSFSFFELGSFFTRR